ncbi:unnamed protein product, partial [Effrenium voratum]
RNQRVMKAQRYSVSGEFRQQLQELLQQIERTEPHFIRCIKPNPKNQAFVDGDSSKPFFHRPSVAEQLSYQGVLAAIKVARAGFPVRFWHVEFLRPFGRRKMQARTAVLSLRNQALLVGKSTFKFKSHHHQAPATN